MILQSEQAGFIFPKHVSRSGKCFEDDSGMMKMMTVVIDVMKMSMIKVKKIMT